MRPASTTTRMPAVGVRRPVANHSETSAVQRQGGGPPSKGVLALRYDSLSPGCTPDSAMRAELGRRMLCGYRSSTFSRARIGPDGRLLER